MAKLGVKDLARKVGKDAGIQSYPLPRTARPSPLDHWESTFKNSSRLFQEVVGPQAFHPEERFHLNFF